VRFLHEQPFEDASRSSSRPAVAALPTLKLRVVCIMAAPNILAVYRFPRLYLHLLDVIVHALLVPANEITRGLRR
jgi:hypothetical protein